MNSFWAFLLLAVAVASGQRNTQRKPDQQQSEPSSQTDADASRDKRGFIITPLSALPASAVAPLLPYLRELNSASSAQLQASLVQADPQLSSLLVATAPLAVDRTTNDPAPIVVATPVAKVAPAVASSPAIPALTAPAKLVTPVVTSFPRVLPIPATVPQPLLANYPSYFPAARLTAFPSPGVFPYPSLPFRYASVHSSLIV